MRQTGFAAIIVCGALVCGAGCGLNSDSSGEGGSGGLAIVDLDKVAQQLGRDAEIKEALRQKEASLNQHLKETQSSLNAQYEQQKQEIDTLPSDEKTQRLRALQAQVATRLNQARRKAQSDIIAFKAGLIAEFREDVKPVARKIAQSRGLSIVVPKHDGFVLTFEPAVDITAEVAEQLKAKQPARISDAGTSQKH